jgi:hypothetical protein
VDYSALGSQQLGYQALRQNHTAKQISLQGKFVAILTCLVGRDDTACVIYYGINAVKAFVKLPGSFSDLIKRIKIAHKRNSLNPLGHRMGALRVSPHHGDPPLAPRKFPRDFRANASTGAGHHYGSIHEAFLFPSQTKPVWFFKHPRSTVSTGAIRFWFRQKAQGVGETAPTR